MAFKKLTLKSKQLLDEMLAAENPSAMLSKHFDDISSKEDAELRGIIRELRELGYIDVKWADNVPYCVIINNSARTYSEQLEEHEKERNQDYLKSSNESKIFISHRSSDGSIADALFDFFVATGISRDKIFCSSLPGNDVKEKISVEVRETMKNSCLNIAILSTEYYQSAYCLNEAGILWFQDIPIIPIALPEIQPTDMIGFLNDDYKIRRLDNADDLAYIYDTACAASTSNQAKASVVTAETRKLILKYQQLLSSRTYPLKPTTEVSLDITTDDERIVLYYLISKQVRKVTKNTILCWLQDMEIYDVNVDNAFDLLSTLGNGDVVDGTLELSTNIFREYSSKSSQILSELQPIVNSRIDLSSERFSKLWNDSAFDDIIKLFVAYIVDEKIDVFGDRWMAEGQIEDIKSWEEKYFLDSTLSSNYGKCLSLFIHNRFAYESDWTSHGNARAHALCASLKELLFNAPAEIVEELIKVKETYHYDLPF